MSNYMCWEVGKPAPLPVAVSRLELAGHILADWLPMVPNSVQQGFADLLMELLEDGPDYVSQTTQVHCARQIPATFEKQWKQVTSWMLGVAFCRRMVQVELGYRWIAPVSGFTWTKVSTAPAIPQWCYHILPRLQSKIERRKKRVLLPDFVLARTRGGLELSFAESKGTERPPSGLKIAANPLKDWALQARNAKFIFNGNEVPPTQTLVVATRFAPERVHPTTRNIVVRAWNARRAEEAPVRPVAEVLMAAEREPAMAG